MFEHDGEVDSDDQELISDEGVITWSVDQYMYAVYVCLNEFGHTVQSESSGDAGLSMTAKEWRFWPAQTRDDINISSVHGDHAFLYRRTDDPHRHLVRRKLSHLGEHFLK